MKHEILFVATLCAVIFGVAFAIHKQPEPQTKVQATLQHQPVDFVQMERDLDTLRLQQLEIMSQLKLMNGLVLSRIAGEVEEKVR